MRRCCLADRCRRVLYEALGVQHERRTSVEEEEEARARARARARERWASSTNRAASSDGARASRGQRARRVVEVSASSHVIALNERACVGAHARVCGGGGSGVRVSTALATTRSSGAWACRRGDAHAHTHARACARLMSTRSAFSEEYADHNAVGRVGGYSRARASLRHRRWQRRRHVQLNGALVCARARMCGRLNATRV